MSSYAESIFIYVLYPQRFDLAPFRPSRISAANSLQWVYCIVTAILDLNSIQGLLTKQSSHTKLDFRVYASKPSFMRYWRKYLRSPIVMKTTGWPKNTWISVLSPNSFYFSLKKRYFKYNFVVRCFLLA